MNIKGRGIKFSKGLVVSLIVLFVCIAVTIVVVARMYFNTDLKKTEIIINAPIKEARNIDISDDQLASFEDKIKTGFICAENTINNNQFALDKMLLFPMRIVWIKPSSSYSFDYTEFEIMEVLNRGTLLSNIMIECKSEEVIIDPVILSGVIDFESLLDLFHSRNMFTLVIIPTGVVLDQELNGGGKNTTIFGAARSLGDFTMFMREEAAISGILVHEFYHLLNLRHLHSGNPLKISDGYSCSVVSDQVFDTPAVVTGSFRRNDVSGVCSYISIDKDMTKEEAEVIVSNYMAYTNPQCMNYSGDNGLTMEQIYRSRSYIDSSPGHQAIILNNANKDVGIKKTYYVKKQD